MKKGVKIPISVAKQIAKDYKKNQVILLTWEKETGTTTVTTFGKTQNDCELAAEGGFKLKQVLGWPNELTEDKPARQKRKEKELRENIFNEIRMALMKLDQDNYIGLNTIAERDIVKCLNSLESGKLVGKCVINDRKIHVIRTEKKDFYLDSSEIDNWVPNRYVYFTPEKSHAFDLEFV